ncbi:MAG: hypothetical protein KGL95_09220 [Patescibacteria group bacterium]|nr:hypothetical protein [Patescibacteria group bacterium]
MSREVSPGKPRKSAVRAQEIAQWLAARDSQTHSSSQIPYRDLGQNIQGVLWVDHNQTRSQASTITKSSTSGFVVSTGHEGVAELVLPPHSTPSPRRK